MRTGSRRWHSGDRSRRVSGHDDWSRWRIWVTNRIASGVAGWMWRPAALLCQRILDHRLVGGSAPVPTRQRRPSSTTRLRVRTIQPGKHCAPGKHEHQVGNTAVRHAPVQFRCNGGPQPGSGNRGEHLRRRRAVHRVPGPPAHLRMKDQVRVTGIVGARHHLRVGTGGHVHFEPAATQIGRGRSGDDAQLQAGARAGPGAGEQATQPRLDRPVCRCPGHCEDIDIAATREPVQRRLCPLGRRPVPL